MNRLTFLSVLSIITYLALNGLFYLFKRFYDPTTTITHTGVFIFTTVLLLITLVVLIYFLSSNGTGIVESPKEIVGTQEAINTWLPVFIRETMVPHQIQWWNNDKVKALNDCAVEIHNEQVWTDPRTADQFIMFEVYVSEGMRQGVHTVVLLIDRGKKWIEDNWNFHINEHNDKRRTGLKSRNMPYTTPEDKEERLQEYALRLREEGLDDEEINQYLSPYKPKQRPVIEYIEPEQETHETYITQYQDPQSAKEAASGIESDIEKARERNQ